MKKIITLSALILGLTGGIAAADRGRGDRDNNRDRRDRVVVRDHGRNTRVDRNRGYRVNRTRPVFRGNRFDFGNGVVRTYHRPVINVRYRDYYRRPALVVENYDPVPGYLWIQGNWSWNGYEWIWVPGHYDVDARYDDGLSFSGSIRF